MKPVFVLALILAASRAVAGPVGSGDPNEAPATGFPGGYLGTVSLALADDPDYGSRLLDAFAAHLQAVGVMTSPQEVVGYLEQSAAGSEDMRTLLAELGHEPLDTAKASALLLADALMRPAQCRELLDGLDSLQSGIGKQAALMLRAARGTGDKRLFRAMRAAGAPRRGERPRPYVGPGRFALLFDAQSTNGRDGVALDDPGAPQPEESAVPVGRPRASDLARPERP